MPITTYEMLRLAQLGIDEKSPGLARVMWDDLNTGEATYWLFIEANIPNMVTRAVDFLDAMYKTWRVKPWVVDDQNKIAEARYEVIKFGEEMKYKEAILPENSENRNLIGFTDFLGGVPYGAIEMSIRLWELSTAKLAYPSLEEEGAVPPIPDSFFDETYAVQDVLYNILYIESDGVDAFANGLSTETQTELLWWVRNNLILPDEAIKPWKFPIPGEFMSLGYRLFPTKPWGDQKTSPFIFSGNWFDTLYYTTAIVKEVLEPTDLIPFRRYEVKWRKSEKDEDNVFIARPSGFEEYKVDDRVAVLKDAATTRTSQTWKDDQQFQETIWRLAPLSFYEMKRT